MCIHIYIHACILNADAHPGASRRRRSIADDWVQRNRHEGGFAWVRRRGDESPSAPPAAGVPSSTTGFGVTATRAALPGFGAEVMILPSTPPSQRLASHCIALHCLALPCLVLHCIVLHCVALHCIALHCIALHCVALHCTALHCIALHCIALYCIALP